MLSNLLQCYPIAEILCSHLIPSEIHASHEAAGITIDQAIINRFMTIENEVLPDTNVLYNLKKLGYNMAMIGSSLNHIKQRLYGGRYNKLNKKSPALHIIYIIPFKHAWKPTNQPHQTIMSNRFILFDDVDERVHKSLDWWIQIAKKDESSFSIFRRYLRGSFFEDVSNLNLESSLREQADTDYHWVSPILKRGFVNELEAFEALKHEKWTKRTGIIILTYRPVWNSYSGSLCISNGACGMFQSNLWNNWFWNSMPSGSIATGAYNLYAEDERYIFTYSEERIDVSDSELPRWPPAEESDSDELTIHSNFREIGSRKCLSIKYVAFGARRGLGYCSIEQV